MSRRKNVSVILLVILFLLVSLHAIIPNSYFVKLWGSMNKTSIAGEVSQNIPPLINGSSEITKTTSQITIAIDPGHGGIDSGTDKGNVVESEVTLDISKRLKSYLEEKSYNVVMTRSTDISLYMLSNIKDTFQRRDLNARTNIINNSGAEIFVSIHVNSYPKYPKMSGSIVYYNPSIPQSKKLSSLLQEKLNSMKVKAFKRGTHDTQEADFYILKNSNIPGVLVETAFITNSDDRKLLMQNEFRSMIGIAITDGIDNFINSK